jgi:hypothetical protein
MAITKKRTVKFWKCSGIFLVATGILHSVAGIVMGKDYLWSIVKEGVFNRVKGGDDSRGLAFWFLLCGVILIVLGHVLHYYIKKLQQPAPKFLGYWLLGLSAIGCIIMPVSGFWLFIPQALIILFAKRRDNDNQITRYKATKNGSKSATFVTF